MVIGTDYQGANPNNTGDRKRQSVPSDWTHIAVHYEGHCRNSGGTGVEAPAKDNAIYYRDAVVGASANFFVDKDGVETGVPLDSSRYAWHVGIGANPAPGIVYCKDNKGFDITNGNTIGIEMGVCKVSMPDNNPDDPDWYFYEQTYKNTVELVRYLMKKYNISIDNVYRHFDCNTVHKVCPSPMVGNGTKTMYGKTGNQLWQLFKKDVVNNTFSGGLVNSKPSNPEKTPDKNSQSITKPTTSYPDKLTYCGRVKISGGELLNVRIHPNYTYPNMVEYPKLADGNQVLVLGQNLPGNWLYILIANKYYGWVSSTYIVDDKTGKKSNLTQSVSPYTKSLSYVGKVYNIPKGDVLNVRTAPNGNAPILNAWKSLGNTNLIDVKGTDGTGKWLYVSIQGTIGWVSKSYVKKS